MCWGHRGQACGEVAHFRSGVGWAQAACSENTLDAGGHVQAAWQAASQKRLLWPQMGRSEHQ